MCMGQTYPTGCQSVTSQVDQSAPETEEGREKKEHTPDTLNLKTGFRVICGKDGDSHGRNLMRNAQDRH